MFSFGLENKQKYSHVFEPFSLQYTSLRKISVRSFPFFCKRLKKRKTDTYFRKLFFAYHVCQ
eukprot:UN18778